MLPEHSAMLRTSVDNSFAEASRVVGDWGTNGILPQLDPITQKLMRNKDNIIFVR